jgi:archaellum biogenesis ATPase FlaH
MTAPASLTAILKGTGLSDEVLRQAGVPIGNRATPAPAESPKTDRLSPLGQAALAYAKGGWPVFPVHGIQNGHCTCGKAGCEKPGKHPRTTHGLKDATTEEAMIRAWWARWPDGNIGHPTGKVVVLDIDGPAGEAALAELEAKRGKLPATLTARTGREGGKHLYFDANGAKARNSASKLGPHLDIRGEGGYVILPPSIHQSGNTYQWGSKVRAAALPAWFAALLAEAERNQSSETGTGGLIREGQRNAHLASLAGSMRRRAMTPEAIEAGLLKENAGRCDPPLPEREVRGIATSVSRYEPAKPGAQPSGETISLAKMRVFSSIKPEPLRWLWPGRIPLGKPTVIAGDPGLGKSLLTLDIAARVSTGAAFPDGAACDQGSVVLLSAEDDAGDTIRPRLDAAEADVSRIHLLEAVRNVMADGKAVETTFSLERDIPALEDAIQQTGARVVVIDPISAYLGATDSHNNSAVRGLLTPLAALAGRYKVAVVAISHLRKSGGAAIHRIVESLAFSAAARAAWGVAQDPDDKARRLFAPIKQNLAADIGGLAFRIEAPNGIARISWEPGAVAVDVDMVLGGFESREDHSELKEAMEWLKDFLADGPRGAADVKRQAGDVGLKWMTVRRSADSIGIAKRKMGGRGAGWEWALPGESKDAPPSVCDVSIFEKEPENKADNGQSKVKDVHVSNTENLWPESTFKKVPEKREAASPDPPDKVRL